ncbi:MAG TPA: sigma-70 family RNA polymerase sigma factor [Candidatus Angelobacter sp.]|jgi:RNA polymerase sigma-70 factor (ECF subfamily)|nr:sigma-70 family RNA polymerase sigma factor [Candidatus Angelobacter sp.]
MEVTDAAVVAQVLAGDQDAFRILVERHTRSIYSVIYRMTGNPQDTEEIIQEAFLRAYRSLERFELRSSFATWLYRIAVNRTLDFLNAKKMTDAYPITENPDPEAPNEQIQLPSTAPGPDRLLLSGEISSRIAGAMKRLTPVERLAFNLRHIEGKSIEEISAALNLKTDAAKNSIFRAVQKLRQQLAPLTGAAK